LSQNENSNNQNFPSKKSFVGLPARQAAVSLLSSVLIDKIPLDQLLGRYGTRGPLQSLTQRDRALARAIVSTSLRRFGQIEAILDYLLEKPLPKKRGPLREILIAAIAQLLFLESSPHAPINIAVRQCQLGRHSRRFDKLANAVLRRVDRERAELLQEFGNALINTPEWMFARWVEAYGESAAEYVARANIYEAALDLSVKSDPQKWANRLNGIVLPTGSVRLVNKGRIENLAGFAEGEWWVQDAAAALPFSFLGDIKGKRVADICAAPGGKTAQLINAGALVTAVDNSAPRIDRLKENLSRLKFDAETVEADGTEWQARQAFDAILLDAPCSATGTIRRHPDILQLKSEHDIETLAILQNKLLNNALNNLKSGGILVFCTCSIEPEEGVQQIEKILYDRADVAHSPIGKKEIGEQAGWILDGCIRTLPYYLPQGSPELSGIDGFFIARLTKL